MLCAVQVSSLSNEVEAVKDREAMLATMREVCVHYTHTHTP